MVDLLARSLNAALLAGCLLMLFSPAKGQARAAGSSDLSKFDLYGGYGLWAPINSDIYGKYYPRL